jgi:hypothetical protein
MIKLMPNLKNYKLQITNYKIGFFVLFLIYNLAFIILPTPVNADFILSQPPNGGIPGSGPNATPLQSIISNIITLLYTIGGIGVLVMFIWGTIEWIISGGAKDKIDAARKRITNAVIGLVLMALAFFIIRVVGQIVGFNPLGNFRIPYIGETAQQECESRGSGWFWNPNNQQCLTNPTEPGH